MTKFLAVVCYININIIFYEGKSVFIDKLHYRQSILLINK